jgi:Protein of unknown function (DUF4232)
VISRPALLVLAVVAMVAAGCGGSSGPKAGPSPKPLRPPSSATSPPSSPSATPSPRKTKTKKPSPTPSPTAHSSACGASQLTLSLGQSQGAAGSFYTPLVLTNRGSAPCTMFGYPGVSYVAANGGTLGVSASRISGHVATVTLAPGGTASALLHQPNPLVFPPADCRKKKSSGIRVYPPGQTLSVVVTTSTLVCTTTKGRSGVTPMQRGSNPTL